MADVLRETNHTNEFTGQVDSAHAKAKDANSRFGESAKESLEKIEQIRHDTAKQMNTTVDKLDRKVEEKAAEAKKSITGWFGGSK